MNTHEIKLTLEHPLSLLEENNPVLAQDSKLPAFTSELLEREFRHVPRKKSWVLQLDVEQADEAELNKLQADIANHYRNQITSTLADLKEYRRDTVLAFIYGGLFLGACLGLHQLLATIYDEDFPRIFDEGLIIIGWVAMWRPAELITFDWIPIVRRLNMQRKLSELIIKMQHSTRLEIQGADVEK